jgi:hypothetical protein
MASSFDRVAIETRDGLFMVPGECVIGGRLIPHSFLLHTGYAGGVLLDDAFTASSGIIGAVPITNESVLTDSFGHTVRVVKGTLPAFALGRTRLADVPVGFFSGGLGHQKMSVIGCDVLARFHVFIDGARGGLYLSPRSATPAR